MTILDISQFRPAPAARFFVDEDLLGLAKTLAAARKHDVVYPGHPHLPEVPRETIDEEWIPAVAARGLVAITRDRHLRTRPRQLELAHAHGLRVFCLTGRKDMTTWDQLVLVVRMWPQIETKRDQAGPGPWFVGITTAGLVDQPIKPRTS